MRQDNSQIRLVVNVTLLLLIFTAGCSVTLSPTSARSTTTGQMDHTPTANSQWHPTKTPTSSPKPSLESATPTLQPTLTAEEGKSLLLSLLQKNGNCRLPCVWGMTPGVTNTSTIKNVLAKFGNIVESKDFFTKVDFFEGMGGLIFILWEEEIRVFNDFSYYEKDNGIGEITLMSNSFLEQGEGMDLMLKQVFGEPYFHELYNYYMLPHILSNYGNPSQVLIAPFPEEPDRPSSWIPFSLVLVYQEQGFLLEYIFPREVVEGYYLGCPSQVGEIAIVSWSPEREYSLIEMVHRISGYGINELNVDYFRPIEEVTSVSIEEFYEIFIDPKNTTCLKTSKELWPGP